MHVKNNDVFVEQWVGGLVDTPDDYFKYTNGNYLVKFTNEGDVSKKVSIFSNSNIYL